MDIFDKLLKIAEKEHMQVKFKPLCSCYGRIKGSRIGLSDALDMDNASFTLAHELAHHFLHFDKGDMIHSDQREAYEEQADRAAKMLLSALEN